MLVFSCFSDFFPWSATWAWKKIKFFCYIPRMFQLPNKCSRVAMEKGFSPEKITVLCWVDIDLSTSGLDNFRPWESVQETCINLTFRTNMDTDQVKGEPVSKFIWRWFDPTVSFFRIAMIFSVLVVYQNLAWSVSKLWDTATIEIHYISRMSWEKSRSRKTSRKDWKYHGQPGKVQFQAYRSLKDIFAKVGDLSKKPTPQNISF